MDTSKYIGNELHLFSEAKNWKRYWVNWVKPFIDGEVLEVGAGIGVNTELLLNSCPNISHLTSIEPDSSLADEIGKQATLDPFQEKLTIKNCYLSDLSNSKKFDTIVYIDVIEHIEDDKKEMELAKSYLKEGGTLIVLVPAYQFLFSPFDRAIGHYRRYNRKMLKRAIPAELKAEKIAYLDFLGVMASLANKFFLHQEYPELKQILRWDRILVPISKIVDKIIFHSVGKSLVGIWRK